MDTVVVLKLGDCLFSSQVVILDRFCSNFKQGRAIAV